MPELVRLTRRAEFLRVAAAKRKWAAPGVIVQMMPTEADPAEASAPDDGRDCARLGFTVSRKVGNAVKRNRARRRLRAAADQVMARHARSGHDYVLIGRQETLVRPFALLLQDLQTALKRLGVWSDGV